MGGEQYVSMWLSEPQGGGVAEVVFPDLSGETFRKQWTDRQWSAAYDALVRRSEGALLFVHPDVVCEPYTIADAHRLLTAAGEEDAAAAIEADGPTEPWDSEKAAPQVQLVDLLQFLDLRMPPDKAIRVALIISAWDRVCNDQAAPAPDEWFCKRLPYLHQFLRTNCERFQARIYGVSAQGGSFEDEREQQRLRELPFASDRVIVEGPNCKPHDITEPVRWILGPTGSDQV